MTVTDAIDLYRGRPPFRCRDLARVTGISRQAALVHIKRAVSSGRLIIEGVGRRTRYLYPTPPEDFSDPEVPFWADLEHRAYPWVRHVDFLVATGGRCRTAAQAKAALPEIVAARMFNILDFAGITEVTPSFATGVANWLRWSCWNNLIINASPRVAAVLERAQLIALQKVQGG